MIRLLLDAAFRAIGKGEPDSLDASAPLLLVDAETPGAMIDVDAMPAFWSDDSVR